jgi:hypothetical protein
MAGLASTLTNTASPTYDWKLDPMNQEWMSKIGMDSSGTINGKPYTFEGNVGSSIDGVSTHPSFWDSTKELLGDKNFMSGALGLGQLGLGLASYLQQKPILDAQLKAYKQNTAFAKQEQDRRNKNIASFNAFRPTDNA